MKKSTIVLLSGYFGDIPVSKISDKEIRFSIVRLYCFLSKHAKPIAEEMETLRSTIVGDRQDEVNTYVQLMEKGDEESLKAASEMKECVRIAQDFTEMTRRLYDEDVSIDEDIPRVPLLSLYEALADCGFPKYKKEPGLTVIESEFKSVIE